MESATRGELEIVLELREKGLSLPQVTEAMGRARGYYGRLLRMGALALADGKDPHPDTDLHAWFCFEHREVQRRVLAKAGQVMVEDLDDEENPGLRQSAAKFLLTHNTPQRVEVAGDPDAPLHHVDETDWARLTDEEVDRLEELREKMSGGSES